MTTQSLEALSRANEVRSARAAVKRAIGAGEIDREGVAEILRGPDPHLRGMRIYDLFLALPHFGATRTAALIRRACLTPETTIEACPDLDWTIRCLIAWPGRPIDDG